MIITVVIDFDNMKCLGCFYYYVLSILLFIGIIVTLLPTVTIVVIVFLVKLFIVDDHYC